MKATDVGPRATGRVRAASWVADLRDRWEAEGFTPGQIATASGLDPATVRAWAAGRRIPELSHLLTAGRVIGQRLVVTDARGYLLGAEIQVMPGGSWEDRELRKLITALRSRRAVQGRTQAQTASDAGISTWSLAQIEAARLQPRPAVLAALAAALETTMRWQPTPDCHAPIPGIES